MMKNVWLLAAVLALLAIGSAARATTQTYSIVDYPAYQLDTSTGQADHVSGTIIADPTTGVIGSATFTITGATSYTVASASTGHPVTGPAYYIQVTPTQILVTPNNPSNPLGNGDLRLYGSTGVSGSNSSAVMQWYTPGDPWVVGSNNWAGYTGTVGSHGSGPLFSSSLWASSWGGPFPLAGGTRGTIVVATVVPAEPAYGISNRAAYHPIISTAAAKFNFKVWGKVTILVSGNSFTVDDGSGMPVKVVAPGFGGVQNGDYAYAKGSFSGEGSNRVLNADISDVVKLP
jgi:hypothetical protein